MVGDWVDESPDATVRSTIRWGDNKAYLVRNSSVQVGDEKVSSSLMILGWDPRSGQLHSWLFDSEGGHGEATWTRASDNQWILRAEGVQSDGSTNSATQIVTIVNRDAVKTSSVDRIIGGEVAPDIDEVLMVRKPPAPAGAAPAATPGADVTRCDAARAPARPRNVAAATPRCRRRDPPHRGSRRPSKDHPRCAPKLVPLARARAAAPDRHGGPRPARPAGGRGGGAARGGAGPRWTAGPPAAWPARWAGCRGRRSPAGRRAAA